MSASREKKKRAEERGGGTPKNAKVDLSGVIAKRIGYILVTSAVLALIVLALFGQGLPQRNISAATIDGEDISVVELNYYYLTQVNSFLQMYGSMLQYSGIDLSIPLSEQAYDETMSWGDYLLNTTFNQLVNTVLFAHFAAEEGIALTERDLSDIEKNVENIKISAQSNGMSLNKYLSNVFGRGMNESVYRACMERALMSNRYTQTHLNSFTYSEAEIQSYYDQNSRDFDVVDYRQFAVTKDMSDEDFDAAVEAGEDLEAMVTTPLGEMTAEHKKAYDTAVKLAEDSSLTPENFNELAKQLAPEENKEYYDEDPDYGRYTDVTWSDSELMNWLFDPARKSGDVTVIDTGTTFTTVMLLSRSRKDDATATLREILIVPEGDSDSAWNDADMRASNIFRPIENASVTETDFAKLADDNTQDYENLEQGGLRKEVSKGDMYSGEIDEWLFDGARRPGDITMIKSDSGYHILYYVSAGRPQWQADVENKLRNDAYDTFQSEKVLAKGSAGNPVRHDFGLSFLVKV